MRVLVVDDEKQIRLVLRRLLADEGYEVEAVVSAEEALRQAQARPPDLVLMDLSLPGMDGIAAMEALRAAGLDAQVIVMTAYGRVESAVRAMKLGAYHYLEKPFDNDELLNLVARALEQRRLTRQVTVLQTQLDQQYSLENMVGVSGAMQAVFTQVTRVAASEVTVLVEGESGTGKELIVRALHRLGSRRDGPFVALNCAALPAHLIENELFGHEPGAFTDARERHLGKFEQAQRGTLFLDEIGELPPEAQGKLLRVIQEREITRIGGRDNVPVDVRLVAATNRELDRLVRDGAFRQDLYYRLNVVAIRLPPLRERPEDLPVLVDHFLARINQRTEHRVEGVAEAAMALFRQYDWPGNVRELENVLEGAAVMCRGTMVGPEDLPLRLQSRVGTALPAGDATLAQAVAAVERRIIAEALALEGHNRTRTAARLGVTRKTLLAKIAAYGLE
ncbi:MAG: sigma-54 dependent transcriptional regulator [Candidatus Latescibacterota bacterium]|jgi:two-component system response regulator AtoC